MSSTIDTPQAAATEPRLGKKQATRARIVERAIPLFSENGYDNISMDAIAKAARISRANIYLHFKTKAELVAAMLEQLSPEVIDSYQALDRLAPDDFAALRRWVDDASQLWVSRRRQLETLEHALAVEPLVSQRWYQTLSEAADAMVGYLHRFPEGSARERARLSVIAAMLGFERTLYFVLVRDAPADHDHLLDVLAAHWQHVLAASATSPPVSN